MKRLKTLDFEPNLTVGFGVAFVILFVVLIGSALYAIRFVATHS